jgi:hypothetical protein
MAKAGPQISTDTAPDRLTVDAAIRLLSPQLGITPHEACELLNAALRAAKVRLWAGDAVVDPNFTATHLRAAVRIAPDGRWSAAIETTRVALEQPVDSYAWAVSNAHVAELLREKSGWHAGEVIQQFRQGPQIDRVRRVLPKLYPPDGKVPAGVTVAAVWGKVAAELAPESEAKGMAEPSWDVVDAVIKEIGRRAD